MSSEPKRSFAHWAYVVASLLPWLVVTYAIVNSPVFPGPIEIVAIAIGAVATYRGILRSRSWWRAFFWFLAVPYLLVVGAMAIGLVARLFR